jgi:hypothetical protein
MSDTQTKDRALVPMRFLTNDDGEPWAVFAEGHIDKRCFRRTDVHAAMAKVSQDYIEDFDLECPGRLVIEHFYITTANIHGVEESFEDETFWFCQKGDQDARPVTGVRFQ